MRLRTQHRTDIPAGAFEIMFETEEEKRTRLPYNEFTEHCTGDMASMDTAYHYWMQDKYAESRKWYKENRENCAADVAANSQQVRVAETGCDGSKKAGWSCATARFTQRVA